MRFLVTAGPTREPIDPVRYLSNRSSGRLGYAIAAALREAGHEPVLVSGPVTLAPPPGIELHPVETALEMLAACQKLWPSCDGVFAVAAVADYRPLRYAERKLKRRAGEGRILELAPNPDILATLAAEKERRLAVGFALESDNGEMEARRKLEQKNLDFICLNGPEAQGAASSSLLLIRRDGTRHPLGPLPKEELARALVHIVLNPRQG